VYSAIGGCPTAFIGAAMFMAETKKFDKLAIPYANNAPGNQCWTDTQSASTSTTRTRASGTSRVPGQPGDPSDNAALIQNVADFLKDAEPRHLLRRAGLRLRRVPEGLKAAGVTPMSCLDGLRDTVRPPRARGERRAAGLQRGRPPSRTSPSGARRAIRIPTTGQGRVSTC
jgi:hypothetical protein